MNAFAHRQIRSVGELFKSICLYAFGKPASHRSTARAMAGWRRIRKYGFVYCAWICTLVKSKAHLGIVQEFAIYGV